MRRVGAWQARKVTSLIVASLVTLFQGIPPAAAARFLVFRETYVRDAEAPDSVTAEFSVLNPDGPWLLRAVNGSLEDDTVEKVSSSTAKLNGADVLQPNQFSQSVNIIEVPVTLQSANSLSTQVRSKPGGQLTIEIVGDDVTPPVIAIGPPTSGAIFATPDVPVTITASDDVAGLDPDSLQVSADGTNLDSFFELAAPALTLVHSAVVTLPEGALTLHAAVSDLAGNAAPPAEVPIIVDLTPPALDVPQPAEGAALTTAEVVVHVTYSDALAGVDSATFSAQLDGGDVTADFTVGPSSAQGTLTLGAGLHELDASIQDLAAHHASVVRSFSVTLGPPVTPTSAFIHGEVFDALTGNPLPGAVITIQGLSGSVQTDGAGMFQFPTPTGGAYVLNADKSDYIRSQRTLEVLDGHDVAVETIPLRSLDPQVTEIDGAGGTATSSDGRIEVIVPAGAVSGHIPVQATWFSQDAHLPGPLPATSFFTYALNLAPDGTAFSQPVTVRFVNERHFAPGTEIPVGLYDYASAQWGHEVMAQVSGDGQWVEFQVEHFSSYDCNLPLFLQIIQAAAELINLEALNPNTKGQGCSLSVGSEVCMADGDLRIQHALPGLRTLGASRAPVLAYNSLQADPTQVIGVDYNLDDQPRAFDSATEVPEHHTAAFHIEGIRAETTFQAAAGEHRFAFLWDGVNARGERVQTGVYPYVLELSNNYQANYGTAEVFGGLATGDTGTAADVLVPRTRSIRGRAILVDRSASELGAGWGVAGLTRLFEQPDGTALIVDGDGSAVVFRPERFLDVAVALLSEQGFATLRGHGDGTFQPAQRAKTGTGTDNPNDVALGDFNQDGFQDLVIAHTWTNQLVVLTGDGTRFANPATLAAGGFPQRVRAVDVTGDGLLDLLTVNNSSNDISLFVGHGDATFQPEQRLSAGSGPVDVLTGDVNGDALIDLIVINSASGDATVLVGTGGGSFQAQAPLAIGPWPRLSALADLNDDGHLDLAVPNFTQEYVSLLFGNGDGTFQPAVQVLLTGSAVARRPQAVVTGDFTGDGAIDVMVATNFTNTVMLLVNEFNNFRVAQEVPCGAGPYSMQTADFNDDGLPDLAVSNQQGGDVSIFLSLPESQLTPAGRIPVGTQPYGVALAEMNVAEGALDKTYTALPGDFSMLTRTASGTWEQRLTDGTVRAFDAAGLQMSETDRNGNQTSFAYDAQQRLTRIDYPGSASFEFEYDPLGALERITDSSGRVTAILLDGQGRLTRITNPDLTTRQFAYDTSARLVAQTNERGLVTDYAFDGFGRLQQVELPPNDVFDPATQSSEVRRATRHVAPAAAQGLINALPDGVGTPASPAPLADAPLAGLTDGRGLTMQWDMDPFGNPTSALDPLSRTTLIERDINGQATKVTRPNGNAVDMAYDGAGNLLSIRERRDSTAPLQLTQFEYEPAFNQVTRIINARRDGACPAGCETAITYDAAGNPTAITDALGNVTAFTFDSRGLLLTVTDALGTATPAIPDDHQTSVTYDPVTGNLLTTTDPLNRTAQLSYDPAGNVELSIDAQSRVTAFTYDAMNRLTSVVDPATGTTAYGYDDVGNLTSVTDARSQTTTFAYDALDLLTASTNPLGEAKQFAYDANRNLARVLDAKGQSITLAYDDANQLVSKVLRDVANAVQDAVTYEYDALGNLTLVQDADSRLAFAYDGLGQLLQAQTGDAGTPAAFAQPVTSMAYSYDLTGNRLSMAPSVGTATQYVYDALNRVTGISSSQIGSKSFQYDPLSRLTQVTGGAASAYGYDAASQLLTLTHTLGATTFAPFSYSYDLTGNRDRLADRFGLHQYAYDALSRLTAADHPLASGVADETFTYDPVGNRLTSVLLGSHSYNPGNRLTENADFTYAYDSNGNLTDQTDKTDPTELTIYTYGVENQLTRIDFPDGTSASYRYDGLGRRIEKDVNGAITRYVYDQEDIVLQYQYGGTSHCLTHAYLHGPGIDQPVGFVRDTNNDCNPFVDASGFREPFVTLYADGLGSIVALAAETDGFFRSTILREQYTYDAFGNPRLIGAGPDGIGGNSDDVVIQASEYGHPYAFTGREWDVESGLYYYRARYYEPKVGRFLQEDPIGFAAGNNFYNYVSGNPVTFIDPLGLEENRVWWEKLEEGYYYGTNYGECALDWYAAKQAQSGNPLWMGPGVVAALWTPETYQWTGWTLITGLLAGRYLGRPFLQYYPKDSPQYESRWLTRNKYRPGSEASEALKLPGHNPGTAAREIRPNPFEPIAGPRSVRGGAGKEYFRGWRFPPD